MTTGQIFSVAEGMGHGLLITYAKRLEDSVRAGENTYLTVCLQALQGSNALDFAQKATEAAGLSLFSWVGKSIICLTLPLLPLLKNISVVPESLHPILTLLQNHLGDLYQLAAVVSSVSLLFFGQPFFAIPSLVILGVGFMDRNGWLPLAARQLLHPYYELLLNITGLFTENILNKVLVSLSIIAWCTNRYISRNIITHEQFVFREQLSPTQAIGLLESALPVKINQTHIHYYSFPPVPNIDIQCLVQRFDLIDWACHSGSLSLKLSKDPRFIARHGDPNLKTLSEIVAITRASLQMFVSSVKERRVLAGEPADYGKLHDYLKIISNHVENQQNGITQTDILFRLAIRGGRILWPREI